MAIQSRRHQLKRWSFRLTFFNFMKSEEGGTIFPLYVHVLEAWDVYCLFLLEVFGTRKRPEVLVSHPIRRDL